MNRIKASVASLALAAGAGLMMAMPADAASADSAPAARGKAPACIKVWTQDGNVTKTGYAKNNCKGSHRLKIVWAQHVDGQCQTLAPGHTMSSTIARFPGQLAGVQTC